MSAALEVRFCKEAFEPFCCFGLKRIVGIRCGCVGSFGSGWLNTAIIFTVAWKRYVDGIGMQIILAAHILWMDPLEVSLFDA